MPSSSSSASTVKFVPEEGNCLQRHVFFFDRNKDGIIYPSETFEGFRAIGGGFLLSVFFTVFSHLGLSWQTRPGIKGILSFSFPIMVKNIQLTKHGSDSGVYDKNGRFVASKFEEIFAKHAHTYPNALTKKEIRELLKSNREPIDPMGWIGAYAEWKLLHHLCKDKNGLLQKETVRGAFDGSLFEKMEKERSSKTSKKDL